MIEATSLKKRYGQRVAVQDVSMTVRPGVVTGFLGPNGAGKSTTMRMIIGLHRPTSVTVCGRPYRDLPAPLFTVGALLDAKAVHTGRTAYKHLLAMAQTHRIPVRRVHEVIGLAGLDSVAHKRVGGFSLGMGQRLGIAAALLGNPEVLIFDEPVNGLDPDGVLWVRQLVRQLAAEGRTVLLTSHLMSEMAQTADHIIVLGRGRVLADAPMADLLARTSTAGTRARTTRPDLLAPLLRDLGAEVTVAEEHMEISGISPDQVAPVAVHAGVPLLELTSTTASLEDAYLQLTQNEAEYTAAGSR